MFPGTTLFGAVLVLIIVVSLLILLIRKPHIPLPFSFEEKSRKGKEGVQTVPKPCPHYLGYLSAFPKNTLVPQECAGCTKIAECHVELNTLRKLPRKEDAAEKPMPTVQTVETPEEPSEPAGILQITKEDAATKPMPTVQTVETPEEPSEPAGILQITKEKLVSTTSGPPQTRPSDCPHFFGYLKQIPKNTLIPDECFSCPKMVDCLYFNAASQ